MLRRIASASFFAVVLSFQTPVANAQDQTTVIVTPRVWYSFISAAQTYPAGNASVQHSTLPLYGGSIAVAPANWGGTTLSLTAFYGNGNGNYNEGDACCVFNGHNDIKRFDVEGVAQFPLGTAGAYWSLGLRYILAESQSTGKDQLGKPFSFYSEGKHYLGEIGVGASTAINSSGSQRLFGGITLMAGTRNTENNDTCCTIFVNKETVTDGVVGIDTNFGYSANFGPATFYARYRLFVLSEANAFASPELMPVVHGPEFNLSFKLN